MASISFSSRVLRLFTALAAAIGTSVPLVVVATPAAADFTVCNNTPSLVGVAIGYRDGTVWTTEGWWNIAGGECPTIVTGPLLSKYYYVYAVDYDRGGAWSGTSYMCTQDLMFTIRGIEDCVARGYDRTGFVEIDTANQATWVVYLTEENRTGMGGE